MEQKMFFVALEFPQDINVAGRLFWYGCRDRSVTEGDWVLAPLGRHNRLQKAIVRKTLLATEEDAPYPIHIIKYVRCRYEEGVNGQNSDMVPEICIEDIAKYTDGINVYDEGNCTAYSKGSDGFAKICAVWTGMMGFARQMPAFGVSLNAETKQAIKSNLWLEFTFPQEYCNNGMTFERLLVNVDKSFSGFNVIRFNSKYGYDGRCFYFDLIGCTMLDLYNAIKG
ncbi:MAG: hypothetical protein ACI4QI_02370 [Candidatus Coproplasma sp.]